MVALSRVPHMEVVCVINDLFNGGSLVKAPFRVHAT